MEALTESMIESIQLSYGKCLASWAALIDYTIEREMIAHEEALRVGYEIAKAACDEDFVLRAQAMELLLEIVNDPIEKCHTIQTILQTKRMRVDAKSAERSLRIKALFASWAKWQKIKNG